MDTQVPQKISAYSDHGRRAQKLRTRTLILDAARAELAEGRAVTVESAAARAGVSRTTAYRYFANHRDLIAAAHPQISATSLLPADAPADPEHRLALVMHAFVHEVTLAWEPQLRAALWLALDTARHEPGQNASQLRQGRGIAWIMEALEPLAVSHPHIDLPLLARAIRSAAGVESLIWLTDVGGLSREQAARIMEASAMAVLREAMRLSDWPS